MATDVADENSAINTILITLSIDPEGQKEDQCTQG